MLTDDYAGYQLVTSPLLTKRVEVPVRKSLVVRFLDFALQWNPCTPWHSPDTVTKEVPSDEFLVMGNRIICHPSMLPLLRSRIGAG